MGAFGLIKLIRIKKKVCVFGILIIFLFVVAGMVFFVTRNNN